MCSVFANIKGDFKDSIGQPLLEKNKKEVFLMKHNMKRFLIMSILISGFFMCNAQATYQYFGGSTNFYYDVVSSSNLKQDDYLRAYVKWDYSSSTTSHKEWFQVVDWKNNDRGKGILNYKTEGYIYENDTASGYEYYLRASRENLIDPNTYVSGTWEP